MAEKLDDIVFVEGPFELVEPEVERPELFVEVAIGVLKKIGNNSVCNLHDLAEKVVVVAGLDLTGLGEAGQAVEFEVEEPHDDLDLPLNFICTSRIQVQFVEEGSHLQFQGVDSFQTLFTRDLSLGSSHEF